MLDKPAETFGWGQVTIWQNNTVEPLLSTVINQQELISSIACVQMCGLATQRLVCLHACFCIPCNAGLQ